MAHILITHIICDGGLPKAGMRKQVSPICSNPSDISEGICFLGYDGNKRLKISDIENQKGVYRLPEEPLVNKDHYVWIDPDGKVYYNPNYYSASFEDHEYIGSAVII